MGFAIFNLNTFLMFNLFNFTLLLKGFPMREATAEFEKNQSIPSEEYERFITDKKKEIVEFHLNNNKSYRDFLGKNSFSNWNELPVMTKKDFQKPLAERLSDGFTPKNIYINKTSGSSGDPFIFAKDKYAHAITWASIIHRF